MCICACPKVIGHTTFVYDNLDLDPEYKFSAEEIQGSPCQNIPFNFLHDVQYIFYSNQLSNLELINSEPFHRMSTFNVS